MVHINMGQRDGLFHIRSLIAVVYLLTKIGERGGLVVNAPDS